LFTSLILTLATLQAPGTRLTYRIRVIEPAAVAPRVLASGAVSGSIDTDMRLTLRSDTTEVEALFQITPIGDTVNLGAEFFTRRRVGRSRRGLPLWEEDSYRRVVRLAWNDTARIYPFGATRRHGQEVRSTWVELILERKFAGGEGRPAEEFDLVDTTRNFRMEAVVRPRRARVVLNLVRGDTVSGPRGLDLVRRPGRIAARLAAARRRCSLSRASGAGTHRARPRARARCRHRLARVAPRKL
jgi:hypothetical protein